MAMRRKKNKGRRPSPGKTNGVLYGMRLSLDATIHALMCDMEMDEDFLERFGHYYNVCLDGMKERYITSSDLRRNMFDERGLEIKEVSE